MSLLKGGKEVMKARGASFTHCDFVVGVVRSWLVG